MAFEEAQNGGEHRRFGCPGAQFIGSQSGQRQEALGSRIVPQRDGERPQRNNRRISGV
jgi:hypothetical protein